MSILCTISRRINRVLTGRNKMVCADAYDRDWTRTRRCLDAVLYYYDGEDHCRRMSDFEKVAG